MPNYLVTGGAGFIGSNIVEVLLQEGHKVRVLDNFDSGTEENIAPFRSSIELIKGDIRNPTTTKEAVAGIDFVIHQAALRSVPRSIEDPLTNDDVNVHGTLNVLEASRCAGVKRIVIASSSSVYGSTETLPQSETLPLCPLSPYAVSKLAGEYYCSMFYRTYGLETVSLRYFNVFGPRQDPHSEYANVIPLFINAALNEKSVEVHGDGLQSRDFTYISDTVNATLLAAKEPRAAGHVFNVACGKRHSILDLIHEISLLSGKPLKYRHTEPRKGDPRATQADIRKAEEILGYRTQASFKEGLKKTWEWFRDRQPATRL